MPEPRGLILIVDDTPENIQVLGGLLRDAGYALNVATNGQQALDALDRVIPDLILLDVMMPVMDGFEVCRRLKADPERKDIPVIFLTAKVETESIVQGFEIGAVDYVTKPFQSAELLQRVETHMTLARLRKELAARVDDLTDALGTIGQLQREQDAFLRHELNNVINPIAGYAGLLSNRLAGSDDDKVAGWLGAIMQGTTDMQRVLKDLKNLNEIERSADTLEKRSIPLYGVLPDVVRDVTVLFENRVSINLSPETMDTRVVADLSFLPGVFKNLVKNAVEHVDGREASELGPLGATVTVHVEEAPDSVSITISNGGPAVSEDRLASFFDKFNSTKAGSGGTGLGTSYARLVTEAHGGSISVDSSEVEGTRVRVELPRATS